MASSAVPLRNGAPKDNSSAQITGVHTAPAMEAACLAAALPSDSCDHRPAHADDSNNLAPSSPQAPAKVHDKRLDAGLKNQHHTTRPNHHHWHHNHHLHKQHSGDDKERGRADSSKRRHAQGSASENEKLHSHGSGSHRGHRLDEEGGGRDGERSRRRSSSPERRKDSKQERKERRHADDNSSHHHNKHHRSRSRSRGRSRSRSRSPSSHRRSGHGAAGPTHEQNGKGQSAARGAGSQQSAAPAATALPPRHGSELPPPPALLPLPPPPAVGRRGWCVTTDSPVQRVRLPGPPSPSPPPTGAIDRAILGQASVMPASKRHKPSPPETPSVPLAPLPAAAAASTLAVIHGGQSKPAAVGARSGSSSSVQPSTDSSGGGLSGAGTKASKQPGSGSRADGKGAAGGRSLLSFGDELDGGEATAGSYSIGASTAHRFQRERSIVISGPAGDGGGGGSRGGGGLLVSRPSSYSLGFGPDDDQPSVAPSDPGLNESSANGATTLGPVTFGSAQARGGRPYMEDRSVIISSFQPLASSGAHIADGVQRSYAAVFDGHNGSGAADLAAARLHHVLAADPALRTYTGDGGPPAVVKQEVDALTRAFEVAFRTVDDETLQVSRLEGARDGSTALVVMRLGGTLYTAHAGDSRAVMCRGGTTLRLTEDHKPNLPKEKSRIESIGGKIEWQRCWRVRVDPRDGRPGSGLAVSRSLGDIDFKEPARFVECQPEVTRVALRPGDDFVVLASDGLWDVMSDSDAVEFVRASLARHPAARRAYGDGCEKALTAVAEELLAEALKRGTMDNVSVIIMQLHWS